MQKIFGTFYVLLSIFQSLNIVGQVATLLVDITDHLDKDTYKIVERALQALIEACAGNYDNQESAFEAQVVDALNQIFAYDCSKMFLEVCTSICYYTPASAISDLLTEPSGPHEWGCNNEFISNEAILRMHMCAACGQYSTVE